MKRKTWFKRTFRFFGVIFLTAACVFLIAAGISYVHNKDFKETFYQITSGKVQGKLRILHISDLHASAYDRLVHRAEILDPNLIVLTGDIVDRKTDDPSDVVAVCGKLTAIAPVYYIYGNHERDRQFGVYLTPDEITALARARNIPEDQIDFYTLVQDDLRQQMEDAGVTVLLNRQASVQIGNTTVDIFGILTGSFKGFYRYAEEAYYQYAYQSMDNFKLLLVHDPYTAELIPEKDLGDLILCGHTHGGVVRLPVLGGVYESVYGFFPELRDGKIMGYYEVKEIPMIVSSGLSNQSLLRINNQPELVIIDINQY